MNLSCFKAYDVRGRVPEDLNADIAYRIGKAYARFLKQASCGAGKPASLQAGKLVSCKVVVGRDVRTSSPEICSALSQGLVESGVDVCDIGLCGTEMVYFATFNGKMDGGIMVTASHNPMGYNGMKFVREDSRPISGDSGLNAIRDMVMDNSFQHASLRKGSQTVQYVEEAYISHILNYIAVDDLKPYRVVVNAGNGCAGRIIDLIEKFLPFSFIKINHEPDGTFPNGVPNPLLPENRDATARSVREHRADIGIAWDGDFDRCFFFDEHGNFIEGYYIVGLLASAMLKKHPGAKIIHDPRLTWNTIDIITKGGGIPVQSKTGHAFIKERMRAENAVYGGEMSAHHYFRDFAYCDSGMIPWLLVLDIMSRSGKTLSELVGSRMSLFPASGEINLSIADKLTSLQANQLTSLQANGPASRQAGQPSVLTEIERRYSNDALATDHTDGLSMEFRTWRFNLRTSNTEPVIRLNVESRGNYDLMREKTNELLKQLTS